MGYTFITHFDAEGYKKLYSYLSVIADETTRENDGRILFLSSNNLIDVWLLSAL